MPKTCAIVPAAGRGLRMEKDRPKQFLELSGRPLLSHTLNVLSKARFLSGIFLVVPGDFKRETEGMVRDFCCRPLEELNSGDEAEGSGHVVGQWNRPVEGGFSARPSERGSDFSIRVVEGGAERQDSVFNALERLPPDCEWVLIHDGVRPFVSLGLLEATWTAARKTGAAIAAVPATDTVKRVRNELVLETLSRDEIWLVQTPQVFRKDIILKAYAEARLRGWSGTDDASFAENLRIPVVVVRGERSNIKVTMPEDLVWASWFLGQGKNSAAENVKTSGASSCE